MPVNADHEVVVVTPVVDTEPPARDVRQCRAPSPLAVRRRTTHAPQRRSAPAALSPAMRQAAACADAALRRVLEVIDRRRPAAALHGLLAAGLVDSVLSANRRVAGRDGVAVLRRVRVQAVNGSDTAAEVFASYSRGQRTHAVACRIERVAERWQVVALHIG